MEHYDRDSKSTNMVIKFKLAKSDYVWTIFYRNLEIPSLKFLGFMVFFSPGWWGESHTWLCLVFTPDSVHMGPSCLCWGGGNTCIAEGQTEVHHIQNKHTITICFFFCSNFLNADIKYFKSIKNFQFNGKNYHGYKYDRERLYFIIF